MLDILLNFRSFSLCTVQATCVQYRLVVRDVSTLQILQLYTCLDQISYMDWSSDSLFILCAMYKRGLVQVGFVEMTLILICGSAYNVKASEEVYFFLLFLLK